MFSIWEDITSVPAIIYTFLTPSFFSSLIVLDSKELPLDNKIGEFNNLARGDTHKASGNA